MAWRRLETLGRAVYNANQPVTIDISNKPYTITSLVAVVRADVTTGAAPGTLDDPWDRIIQSLSVWVAGKAIVTYTDMRVAYYQSHCHLDVLAPRRPDPPGASATNFRRQFAYVFHFGTVPQRIRGQGGSIEGFPWDLTGGIPPARTNAYITFTWGASNAPGSGWTVNPATEVEFYAFGVQPESGDPPESYLPRAIPFWFHETPAIAGTVQPRGAYYNIQNGMFLRSLQLLTYLGTGSPRSDQVLNSVVLRDDFRNIELVTIASTNDARVSKAAELITEEYFAGNGWPPVFDPTGATLSAATGIGRESDMGLIHLPLYLFATKGQLSDLYGFDLRGAQTGQLKIYYGIANAAGATLNVIYTKYDLNPEHPANAGL